MSEIPKISHEFILWILGGVIAAIASIVGFRYKSAMNKIDDYDEKRYTALDKKIQRCDENNQQEHQKIIDTMESGQVETRQSIMEIHNLLESHFDRNHDGD